MARVPRSSRAPRPAALAGLLLLGLALATQLALPAPGPGHCVVKMPCCAAGYCPLEGHHHGGPRLVRCDDGSRIATAPVPLPPIVLASSDLRFAPALGGELGTAAAAPRGTLRFPPETPPPERATGDLASPHLAA